MAHENKSNPPFGETGPIGGDARDAGGAGDAGDEFENAVTTAIPGTIARAFDHELGRDVEIISADLAALPDLADDEIIEPGFLLSGRFEIVELVHSGGMSHVYKAIDTRRNLDGSGQIYVAIKVMRQSLATEHNARLALEREAARAQRLSHPNIVNVFDFDEHEGQFFLVMEWLDGESANTLLRRIGGQRLDQAFAWQIIEGTAAGVQHAHLHNVVHADINPSNVFITTTHEIKLLDFGVARNLSDRADIEEDRLLWATKAYASPEVLSELAPVIEDDIFSLGCFAYRLLGGAHPFAGSMSIEAKKEGKEVTPIAGLHENDWQTIKRSLDYDRANRPKSAAVFYRSTQHPGLTEAVDDAPTTEPWQWLLGAAVVVTLVAGAAWWLREAPSGISEPAVVTESPAAVEPAPEQTPEPAAEPEVSVVDSMLESAEQAIADGRFVAPAGNNANELYREVLNIAPGNAAALRGIRSISDRYVREAETALRADAPEDAAAALLVAARVDPGNPAIEIVDYLLVSEASQLLANARAAALSGDTEQANALLASAERFDRADPEEITRVGMLIAAANAEKALVARIELTDQKIDDGELITPTGDSAMDLVLALRAVNGDDARVDAVTNRLGERLLADASLASEAGDFDEARDLINVAGSLGILDAEVEAARAALDAAIVASQAPEEEPADAASEILPAAAALAVTGAAAGPAQSTTSGSESTAMTRPPANVEFGTGAGAPVQTDSVAETTPEPAPPPRRQTLSELGIERYVAPKFPRSARRSDTSGFVEVGFVVNPDGTTSDIEILNAVPRGVFDSSAERAVGQWLFTPRETPVDARVSLSFQPD